MLRTVENDPIQPLAEAIFFYLMSPAMLLLIFPQKQGNLCKNHEEEEEGVLSK